MGWSGVEWSGVGWGEVGWGEVGWGGVGWNGVQWSGVEWELNREEHPIVGRKDPPKNRRDTGNIPTRSIPIRSRSSATNFIHPFQKLIY